MGLDDIPLFAMLKGKLAHTSQRERLVAENVANADTPGYTPRDLKPYSFEQALRPRAGASGLSRTNPMHLAGRPSRADDAFESADSPDSETRLDGNRVVLEEQMARMTEARVDYEAAIDFYQQSMNLVTTAARAPGKA